MIKRCRVCGESYEAYDKPMKSRGRRRKLKRPFSSVTCSKKCANTRYYKGL